MKRLLIFLVLIITAWSCDRVEDDRSWLDGYEFHDDFYYTGLSDIQKVFLEPIENEYLVIFEADFNEEVLMNLEDKGFMLTSYPTDVYYVFNDDFTIPDYMSNCMSVRIKGIGDIEDIPHVIYSDNLYFSHTGSLEGVSNKLCVFIDESKGNQHYVDVLKYAEKLKIIPYDYNKYSEYMFFACTNDSYGNPAEIANWFYEEKNCQASPIWSLGEWL